MSTQNTKVRIKPWEDPWELPQPTPPGAILDPYGIDKRGIKTWKNAGNGFFVGAIHYSSDPEKRSEKWYREATRIFKPWQIEREFEINFESRSGQKAFGYLLDEPKRWRVANFDYRDIPRNWRIIASLDYGTTNPTALYFWAIDQKRRMYAIYEFYKPSSVREIAKVLKGVHQGPNMDGVQTDYRHPLWKRCEKVVVDGAIFNKNQENGDEGLISVGDLLEEQGIYTMERATKDRAAGLARLHDMFAPSIVDPDQAPSLYFTKKCVHLWKEFTELVYEELPPHLLLNKNQKEDVVAKNDHGYDSARYACMAIQAPSEELPPDEPETGSLAEEEALLDLSDAEEREIDYL